MIQVDAQITRAYHEEWARVVAGMQERFGVDRRTKPMAIEEAHMARTYSYLHFGGTTEEAFNFYKAVFGTEFVAPIVRMGDLPAQPGMPEMSDDEKTQVMNVHLPITGGHLLVGNDAPAWMGTVNHGNALDIGLEMDTRVEADRIFAALANLADRRRALGLIDRTSQEEPMVEHTPIDVKNLALTDNLRPKQEPAPLDWAFIRDQLAVGSLGAEIACFLGTVGADGQPHSAGVGPVWFDGDLYFVSSPNARKARHLATNPNCTLSFRLPGYDLTLEGTAELVVDRTQMESIAKAYNDGGWPAYVEGEGFNAPFMAGTAGPPPWRPYRFVLHTAVALKIEGEEGGATRWRF